MTLHERFEQFADEFLKYDNVTNRLHSRPDLNAFLLLHEIQPKARDMVSCAEHDQIWLDTDMEEFEAVVTDEQIANLVRCGVMYDEETESLSMFA